MVYAQRVAQAQSRVLPRVWNKQQITGVQIHESRDASTLELVVYTGQLFGFVSADVVLLFCDLG